MTLKELYESIDGDYEQAVRVLRMDKLIDKHIRKFTKNGVVEKLVVAGKARDAAEIFECAHALKGICGNLGLKSLADPASELAEEFRPGDIFSMNGHVWICLGRCGDGSLVILHSAPGESRTGGKGGGPQLGAVGSSRKCEVSIPKFEYETSLGLNSAVESLGLGRIFTEQAELGGLSASGENNIAVSSILQKAKVILNEHGTKAAAATGMEMAPPASCSSPVSGRTLPWLTMLARALEPAISRTSASAGAQRRTVLPMSLQPEAKDLLPCAGWDLPPDSAISPLLFRFFMSCLRGNGPACRAVLVPWHYRPTR